MVAIERVEGDLDCGETLCVHAGRTLNIEGGDTDLESRDTGFRSAISAGRLSR